MSHFLIAAVGSANIRFDGAVINVDANSEARIERTTATICDGIDGARVVIDERKPFDVERDRGAVVRGAGVPPDGTPMDPVVVAQVQEMMERRWLDEHIPALGGLTTRSSR